MIRIALPSGEVELTPDQARAVADALRQALFAHDQEQRKAARKERADAMWSDWLRRGAIAETSGGLVLFAPGWTGPRWLRQGQVESELPGRGLVFTQPIWARAAAGGRAHYYTGLWGAPCGVAGSPLELAEDVIRCGTCERMVKNGGGQ